MSTVSPYHAIADPKRWAILDLLRDQGPCTTGTIATLSRPAISKHLQALRTKALCRKCSKVSGVLLTPVCMRSGGSLLLHVYGKVLKRSRKSVA